MSVFEDPESMQRAVERLTDLTGVNLTAFTETWFEGNASPALALTNLERWLTSTTSPGLHMEQILALPRLGKLLLTIMGASQPLADCLIQNPELASIILEPGELRHVPKRDSLVAEGLRLHAAASSHQHALDRLRFLKQRWTLPIVMNDLTGQWEQAVVWRALSDLADALIDLAYQISWEEARKAKDLPVTCPIAIVGFGKLGGHELNYSSDVDLVYVAEDDLDEKTERECVKFCEAFGRALSNKMGRGSLFRVDLRLRPYGGAGPILRSMRSVQTYYNLYAEPWEVQALLRSRVIVGPPELAERWEAMRLTQCFKPRLSELALEHMLDMRRRIEDYAIDDDLKRGAGGIRDVEFLTQVLQMVHGFESPDLQVPNTCEALAHLEAAGRIDHPVSSALISGYTFLRKLEHRAQLVGDRQTHSIPASPEARLGLAKLMGANTWAELDKTLGMHRRTIHTLYKASLGLESTETSERDSVMKELGPYGASAVQWFDVLPEAQAFYSGLAHNEGSIDRVRKILAHAPHLVPYFKQSLPLTELLMSGEIEEEEDATARLKALPAEAPLKKVAETYSSAYARLLAGWVLAPNFDLGECLSDLFEALLDHCLRRIYADLEVLALGSFGNREMSAGSDGDLLLLVPESRQHAEAEVQAQNLLAMMGQLKRYGTPVELDLRLRPEGGKGLLVRTYDGLRAYDFDGMEMWERFALGHARLLRGSEESLAIVQHSAYALPLTPERLKELIKMKRRVETERVQPKHIRRNVKLGYGGLNDIEWLVHLHEMRFPTATKAGSTTRMVERIRNLGRARLLNAVEVEELLAAHRHLLEVRNRLYLLGLADDVVPENPDKLERLSQAYGLTGGNVFLARHQPFIEGVRRLYLEGLERLRA